MTDHARDIRITRRPGRRARTVGVLLALAIGSGSGCGREFFRQWANQDVSEVVFEKSRDPRWQLGMFSVEPPALSRFSNPYDPDRPPAPPDDHAAEALSPVPQWPDHRLLVPVEGTGYLDMLEEWKRDRPVDPSTAHRSAATPATAPTAAPAPPPPSTSSPFAPEANPGTGEGEMSPMSLPGLEPEAVPPAGGEEAGPPLSSAPRLDPGVRIAAYQETNIPLPVTPQPSTDLPPATPGENPAPRIPLDPAPINPDLSRPVNPRPDLPPGEERAAEAATADMSALLVPGVLDFDEAEASGLPPGSQPYVVNPEQALRLALINSRAYQFRLENIYLQSLAVTLQRFAFEPQVVAGLTPFSTPTAAGNPASFPNTFLYSTREAPGGQQSTLSLGTVAGFGKVFINGTRLLTAFANRTVFNFVGSNPRQPTVQSILPLSIVQPFLRGGGRAVTLELLTQAERSLLYEIRSFARFRQEFFVNILGAQAGGLTNPGLSDPTIGYLQVLQLLQVVENSRYNVASFVILLEVFSELAEGESSGLTQLQIDQMDQSLQGARQSLLNATIQYQNALDQFKQQIGLPPDVPMVLDRRILAGFRETFIEVLEWSRNPNRELEDLVRFAAQLPKLQEVVIDGREVLEIAGVDPERDPVRAEDEARMARPQPDKQEDLLLAAERVMLENRLDLMNARAQLYDAWRQVKVTANGLLGTFNVTLTNQIYTPTTTTNPFAFVDQAKQFSLVFNAELPLVRVADRNSFRASLIDLERQRRALMNAEDTLKFTIRSEIRQLQLQAQSYEIALRTFILNLRQKDQSQEQLIAPPAGTSGGGGNAANAATQTNNLTGAQNRVLGSQNSLVQTWVNYQTSRLILYRDLGIMPYDEWEAYYELFPTDDTGVSAAVGSGPGMGPAGVAAPAPAPTPVGGP